MSATGPCNNCGRETNLKCKECTSLRIAKPSCIGFFDCKDCQLNGHLKHKILHRLIKKGSKDFNNRGTSETIILAIQEAFIKGIKPNLFNNDFNLIFVGARDVNEYQLEYDNLVVGIRSLFYPELNLVNITMVGPGTTNRPSKLEGKSDESKYSVTTKEGKLEALYPTADALKDAFSFVIILHPGFQDFLLSWKPAMDIIVASDLLFMTTGYSNYDRLTRDAIHEDLVNEYYCAKVILTPTFNAAACLPISRNGIGPHFIYSLYKGIDQNSVKLSYEETVHKSRLVFLRYVGHESINYEGNPTFGRTCLLIADDIESKKLVLSPHVSLSAIENIGHYQYHSMTKDQIKQILEAENYDDDGVIAGGRNPMNEMKQLFSTLAGKM